MPTENEKKYVLYCDREIIEQLRPKFSRIVDQEQAILKEGSGWVLRIRKSSMIYISNGKTSKNPQYTLTFKQKTNGRQIEIEQKLDQRDYQDLFDTCIGHMFKRRHVILDGQYEWEIDAYMSHPKDKDPYFILAEVELDEDEDEPNRMPEFITDNLLYSVGINERGFSSKKLRDSSYARTIYDSLLGSNRDEKTKI